MKAEKRKALALKGELLSSLVGDSSICIIAHAFNVGECVPFVFAVNHFLCFSSNCGVMTNLDLANGSFGSDSVRVKFGSGKVRVT